VSGFSYLNLNYSSLIFSTALVNGVLVAISWTNRRPEHAQIRANVGRSENSVFVVAFGALNADNTAIQGIQYTLTTRNCNVSCVE